MFAYGQVRQISRRVQVCGECGLCAEQSENDERPEEQASRRRKVGSHQTLEVG